MKEEIPLCPDCGQPMKEIGGTGKTITYYEDLREFGAREQMLYQCPEDKTIALL